MGAKKVNIVRLFHKFKARFEQFQWEPGAFVVDAADHLPLFVRHPAPYEETGVHYCCHNWPRYNTRVQGLGQVTSSFDPKNERSPVGQLVDSLFGAIEAGPFKDRTFIREPARKIVPHDLHNRGVGTSSIPVRLKILGGPVPGLILPTSKQLWGSWPFFIPENSPEGKAFEAAVAADLAESNAAYQASLVQDKELPAKRERVRELLAQVGA